MTVTAVERIAAGEEVFVTYYSENTPYAPLPHSPGGCSHHPHPHRHTHTHTHRHNHTHTHTHTHTPPAAPPPSHHLRPHPPRLARAW